MNTENLVTVLNLVKHSNLAPTTKSFIGGIFKDMTNFDEAGYEESAKEHNEEEMDLIAQVQALLEELLGMEESEMEGEEMEAEYEENEDEDEEDEDEDDMFDEEDEEEEEDDEMFDEEGEEDEDEMFDEGFPSSVKVVGGMF